VDNRETAEMLNAVPVTKEELERVITEAEKLHAEGTDEDGGGMYLIARLFKEQPQKAEAIYFRMMALANIIEKQSAPGWTLPSTKDGAVFTKQELIDATAVFPLSVVDGDIGFELKGFLSKALVSQGRGNLLSRVLSGIPQTHEAPASQPRLCEIIGLPSQIKGTETLLPRKPA